tara:strand:+ start:1081 stop:1611 length:531 start_codon:yes stop_codon:yes gene_type:complete
MNLQEAINEIQQPRSRYSLIHFVIGQHDTPEMQFHQLVLELQTMSYRLASAKVSVRKGEIEIARLLETGDEIDACDAEEKQLGVEQTRTVMLGAEREIEVLTDIFNNCRHFTHDEIEHAQAEYWNKRLTRQTNLQLMAGGVKWSQLDAMRQVGLLDELVEERERQLVDRAKLELTE